METASPSSTRLTFLILAVGVASFSMLQSLLTPVLPTLQRELQTTQSAISWVLIAWLLSSAVATPIIGKIGDTRGKAKTLCFALSGVAVGSFIAAIASNVEMVVIGRIVQGLGGAAFPIAFGIIRDEFPSHRVAPAIGSMSAIIAVGGGAGTLLAGPVVDMLGWRWLFWIPMITMTITVLLAWRFIPESPVRNAGRINWLAAILLAGWLVALLLPLTQASRWGWTSPLVVSLFATAVVLLVVWYLVERRADHPLIDMKMMTMPAVWKGNLLAALFGASMFAVWVFVPQLIQVPREAGYGFGASITEAGWIMLPMLVTMAFGGMISGRTSGTFSFKSQLIVANILIAISCMGFAFRHVSFVELAIASGIFGIGLGLAYAALTSIMVKAVPRHQTGIAIGMNANIRTIGGALGTAIMTAIITGNRQPGGLPAEEGFTIGFTLFGIVAAVGAVLAFFISSDGKDEQVATTRASPVLADEPAE